MFLHTIPCLYVAGLDVSQCELTDFYYSDLSVKPRSGIKMGRKVVRGILTETAQRVRQFTTLTRRAVGVDRVVSHQVQYLVIDDELDTITDSMVLWLGMPPSPGGLGARWPLSAKG